MPDGSGVRSVDVGPGVACAVTTSQRLYCWGTNGDGETGIGYVSAKVSLPAAVLLPAGVVPASVSVGLGRVCALDTTGTGWCWGDNYEGSFGDGTYTDSRTPRRVLTPGARRSPTCRPRGTTPAASAPPAPRGAGAAAASASSAPAQRSGVRRSASPSSPTG